ncbi:MAG TPA: nitronate monooxygenase, partial [Acidimicrobiales bacterium]|nr:nitronate monooxygenase [Acidimicrobiales bacterium]
MFDIEFPVMAFSHCRDVVAAVSKAGGLGVLGAVGHSDEGLEVDLAWIEDEIGDLPYGVDLIVPARYAGDSDGGFSMDDIVALIPEEHREFLADMLDRYGVAEHVYDAAKGWVGHSADAPFSANRAARQVDIALAHRPSLMA